MKASVRLSLSEPETRRLDEETKTWARQMFFHHAFKLGLGPMVLAEDIMPSIRYEALQGKNVDEFLQKYITAHGGLPRCEEMNRAFSRERFRIVCRAQKALDECVAGMDIVTPQFMSMAQGYEKEFKAQQFMLMANEGPSKSSIRDYDLYGTYGLVWEGIVRQALEIPDSEVDKWFETLYSADVEELDQRDSLAWECFEALSNAETFLRIHFINWALRPFQRYPHARSFGDKYWSQDCQETKENLLWWVLQGRNQALQ